MEKTLQSIPQPKTYGPLGNLPLIDRETPTLSLCKVADEYGPIFRFKTPKSNSVIVSGYKLAEECFDETRFAKTIRDELENVRAFGGDGLFTSRNEEPNWQKAHNILFPTFSQTAMKGYHSMMVDIASQLIQKWERLNAEETIDVPGDMTRLTLDTIGLCGFNYRFNSFYRENHSPFINSMVRALSEAMHQSGRLEFQNKLMFRTKQKYQQDIQTMFILVDKLIQDRKENGDNGEMDLLARMLKGKDPETGEMLDDENIRYQMITFLIAGHETTSGLLSFALYYMMKDPAILQKAYQEVDAVLTDEVPSYKQVLDLKYIKMILNEALRLWPTAPGFGLCAKEDTVIGGKYLIKKGQDVGILLPQLHRDKEAWGEDAEQFRPERFADPSKIPAAAFKPFGNGQRACIGMQFALHEATLVLGMILQHFELDDFSNYQLKISQTLTLKPGDFHIRVRARERAYPLRQAAAAVETPVAEKKAAITGADDHKVLVLYGSDLGSAEGVARELADTAKMYGFQSEVASLDTRAGDIPTDVAVLIVTASYNGHPPTNAKKFVKWLRELDTNALQDIPYAVLGCGDRNWASTYQDVPRLIDELFAKKGANRFSPRGESDASEDFEKHVEDWKERMWQDMLMLYKLEMKADVESIRPPLDVQFVHEMDSVPLVLAHDAAPAQVLENRELQLAGSDRSTRHLELQLPAGMTYQEGDHLGVLPKNRAETVKRIVTRFALNEKQQILLTADGRDMAHLPMDQPITISDLLYYCVDVQGPATRAQLRALAAHTECPPHKRELEALLEADQYQTQVLEKRLSVLHLLECYPACGLPFATFLELLPPLKPRYYSISSSPEKNDRQASITVGVVRDAAWDGNGEYCGVASNHLAGSPQGTEVMMFTKTPESGFNLPEDTETPIIMIGPGTGIAPFRGFLQARAAWKQAGKSLGTAHLYFGCRNEAGFLYRTELEQYVQEGIVHLHTAFSRKDSTPKTYVQYLLENDANQILETLQQGGRIYVCGDGKHMVKDVEATLCRAYQQIQGTDEQTAKDWLLNLQKTGQYAKDVWEG